MPGAITAALSGPLGGYAARRFGSSAVVAAGVGVMTATFAALAFLRTEVWHLIVAKALIALASGADRDHAAGFAAYEHDTREFVTVNQGLVGEGGATLFPTTAQALEQRNNRLRKLSVLPSRRDDRPIRPSPCPISRP
ncbi:hypothetical protein [Spongiactinospora gelatinilytica]|uniref:hypothetical protein n=1 Tax=Spongiactinospora gelatinilytica TaxID=2666298 RepID=UPI0018F53452|nr:hypothetical protein [Spongiactinospora gelatinilytica]